MKKSSKIEKRPFHIHHMEDDTYHVEDRNNDIVKIFKYKKTKIKSQK